VTSVRVHPTRSRMVALDALSHPLSVGATGLLILNDHVLKSAMPGLVTGKLSDFAGLFFFPFLATFALSFLSVRRPDVVGFVGTAVWFLGMKLLPGIARATESMFPWPTRITVDWTDLIALVSLFPAYKLWHHLNTHPISDIRRRKVRRALMLGVASVATLATQPYQPPSVGGLSVVDDDLYAYVGADRLFIYHSPDYGVTWREIEEVEELPDGFPVIGYGRGWSDVWWVNGVLTGGPILCLVEDSTMCYLHQIWLSDYEVSEDGGLSWTALPAEVVPELFEEGVPYVYLDWIWCDRDSTECLRSGGEPRLRVVEGYFSFNQPFNQMSFDGGQTWEPGWLPGLEPGRVPQGTKGLELVRCEPTRLGFCYRPTGNERTLLQSTNGGMTWGPAADQSLPWQFSIRNFQLEGLVCVTDDHCFRGLNGGSRPTTSVVNAPDPAEGWRPGAIEETRDGGSSWHQSWTVSPRYGGNPSAERLAIPADLAAVGEPKTLLVSLGEDGMLRRASDGTWETIGIGPVSSLSPPLIPWDGPRVALAWTMSLALVVFGAYLVGKPRPASGSRLVGSIIIAIGVSTMLIYLIQTAEYPYGIAYSLIGEALFNGVPLLTLTAGGLWLLRRSGPAEAKKALARSLAIGAIPLLLSMPALLPRIL